MLVVLYFIDQSIFNGQYGQLSRQPSSFLVITSLTVNLIWVDQGGQSNGYSQYAIAAPDNSHYAIPAPDKALKQVNGSLKPSGFFFNLALADILL